MFAAELFVLFITILLLAFSVIFMAFVISITIWGDWHGAPFVRSKKGKIKIMIELAEIRPGTRSLELGSGDATLLIEAARAGAYAEGIEINPFLVWYSRRKIKKLGLEKDISITKENIFKVSFADRKPNVVFVYLMPEILEKLRERFLAELPKGTKLISNAFQIKGFEPTIQKDGVYLYILG